MGDQGQFYMNPFIHTKFAFIPMSSNSQSFTGFAKTQVRGSGVRSQRSEKRVKRVRKNMT